MTLKEHLKEYMDLDENLRSYHTFTTLNEFRVLTRDFFHIRHYEVVRFWFSGADEVALVELSRERNLNISEVLEYGDYIRQRVSSFGASPDEKSNNFIIQVEPDVDLLTMFGQCLESEVY